VRGLVDGFEKCIMGAIASAAAAGRIYLYVSSHKECTDLRTLPSVTKPLTVLPSIDGDRWLTLGQACKLLNVDESTLRRWADAGQVRTFRTPGGHRRFAEMDVRAIVEGRGKRPKYAEVGDLATKRIRRGLHQNQNADWYSTVDDAQREKLRTLGRSLMTLVADYVAKKGRKATLLEEARATGQQYGAELASAGMSLSQAMHAFTFFRRSLDSSAKQALAKQGTPPHESVEVCEQIMALADEVLLGIAGAYEAGR
jgi:excisionase family DNA binding protein